MKRMILVSLLALGLAAACVQDSDDHNRPGDDAGHDAGHDADADPDEDADGLDDDEEEPNDSPSTANRFEVGEELTGTVEARDEGHDADVFRVEVEPGQTVRLEVEADDQLEPVLFVSASGEDVEAMLEDQVYGIAEALPVGGTAALEFHHPESAEAQDYYAVVVDDRNLPAEPGDEPDTVGGEEFGYTLSSSDIDWNFAEESLPIETVETLEPIGSYLWYEFDVDDESLLGFETFTSVDDFFPDAAFFTDGVVELAAAPVGVPFEQGGTIMAGVGEPFYRGGSDYEFELILRQMSYGDLDFGDVEASGDNNESDSAQDLSGELPVRVSGTLGDESEDFANREIHYYAVDLEENEQLGLFTEAGADDEVEDADTILVVYEPEEGREIVYNDDYPLQPDSFFSGAFFTALTAGEYIVAVEPFCQDQGGETVCDGGDYTLNVFSESGG